MAFLMHRFKVTLKLIYVSYFSVAPLTYNNNNAVLALAPSFVIIIKLCVLSHVNSTQKWPQTGFKPRKQHCLNSYFKMNLTALLHTDNFNAIKLMCYAFKFTHC